MKNSIFLHFGPGGNSGTEREIFESNFQNIFFWNQPRFQNQENPFRQLTLEAVNEIKKLNSKISVISHSFGCDIAANLVSSKALQSETKILFVSPILNLHNAFHNLAKKLNSVKTNEALHDCIQDYTIEAAKKNPMHFWNLVSQCAQHENYFQSFWSNVEVMQHYIPIMMKYGMIDQMEWQAIIADYITHYNINILEVIKNTNSQVVLGSDDPYLSHSDFKLFINEMGPGRVCIIEKASHFVHLEQSEQFKRLVKSWLVE